MWASFGESYHAKSMIRLPAGIRYITIAINILFRDYQTPLESFPEVLFWEEVI